MKKSSFALLFLFMGAVATAAPILWSLPSVTLHGCCLLPVQTATASGSFFYDAFTNTYSDWRFSISGFTAPVEPLNGILTPANSTLFPPSPTSLHLLYASGQADFALGFGFTTMGGFVEVPLPPFGGTVPAVVGNSARFESFYTAATTTVSSVPEPVAGVLVLVGAAMLCFWKPGRFRARRGTP